MLDIDLQRRFGALRARGRAVGAFVGIAAWSKPRRPSISQRGYDGPAAAAAASAAASAAKKCLFLKSWMCRLCRGPKPSMPWYSVV